MQPNPRISLVAARARNGVIGADGGLPWHLSADLKHFKALTLGKPVVMGRKTWASIGKPLPGRLNIVISRDPGFTAPGAVVVSSLDAAIEQAAAPEVMIIGGAEIYAQALARADRLYLTDIDIEVKGDAYFPAIDPGAWGLRSQEPHPAAGDQPGYCFKVYDRV